MVLNPKFASFFFFFIIIIIIIYTKLGINKFRYNFAVFSQITPSPPPLSTDR